MNGSAVILSTPPPAQPFPVIGVAVGTGSALLVLVAGAVLWRRRLRRRAAADAVRARYPKVSEMPAGFQPASRGGFAGSGAQGKGAASASKAGRGSSALPKPSPRSRAGLSALARVASEGAPGPGTRLATLLVGALPAETQEESSLGAPTNSPPPAQLAPPPRSRAAQRAQARQSSEEGPSQPPPTQAAAGGALAGLAKVFTAPPPPRSRAARKALEGTLGGDTRREHLLSAIAANASEDSEPSSPVSPPAHEPPGADAVLRRLERGGGVSFPPPGSSAAGTHSLL